MSNKFLHIFSICCLIFAFVFCILFLNQEYRAVQALADIQSINNNSNPYQGITLAGRVSDVPQKTIIEDDLLYILAMHELSIVDISDIQNPRLVGHINLPTIPHDFKLANNYIYIAWGVSDGGANTKGGLKIIDVSDPTAPIIVGSYDASPEIPNYLEVVNEHVYLGMRMRLEIIDVQDRTNPTFSSSRDITSYITNITKVNEHLHIGTEWLGLQIWDLTYPETPNHVATHDMGNWIPKDIIPYQEYILVTDYQHHENESHLRILEVSNPIKPIQTDVYTSTKRLFSPTISNGYFFARLTDYYSEENLQILDISNKFDIKEHSTFPAIGYISDVTAQGNYVFMGDSESGIRILDTSNINQLKIVGNYFTYNGSFFSGTLAFTKNVAYGGVESGFKVFNIFNPVSLKQVDHVITPSKVTNMYVAEPYLFVGTTTDGVFIYDISVAEHPNLLGQYDELGFERVADIKVKDTFAYIAGYEPDPTFATKGSLHVVNITEPTSPTQIGRFPIMNITALGDIAMKNNYVYIRTMAASGNSPIDDLIIIDISDPVSPSLAGSYDLTEPNNNINGNMVVSGNLLYLGHSDGLHVLDITSPSTPIEIGSLGDENTNWWYYNIATNDKYLYALQSSGYEETGLQIVDISDPVAPKELDHKLLSGTGTHITSFDNILYTAVSGLSIWQHKSDSIGYIVDINASPISGTSLESENTVGKQSILTTRDNAIAATGLTGSYTVSKEDYGTHILAPTLKGYSFWPPTKTIELNETSQNQNFIAMAATVSTTLTTTAQTLEFITLQKLPTQIHFPPNSVTETIKVTFSPRIEQDLHNFAFARHAFDLQAFSSENNLSEFNFSHPISVSIQYSNRDIQFITKEDELTLWYWENESWVDAVTTCTPANNVSIDANKNIIHIQVCQTGRYSLFGPTNHVYLPTILKQ